jgi:hypothetical protein
MKYKYELLRGSKHIVCPNCHHKTFKPYVLASDGKTIVDADRYGRCERINSCRYILYPKTDDSRLIEYVQREEFVPEKPKEPDFIPRGTVESTFNHFRENVFFRYLIRTFGQDVAYELQECYNIGTARNGGTIFWQQDKEGNFRTGKIMYYAENGHRLKNVSSWYVHKRINPDFNLVQVFFGEHLVTEDKPIALCESEKTAIMMSIFRPEFTWIAAGGSEMLNNYRLNRLPRLDKVYPDNGQFDKWEMKTNHFPGRQMDVSVDKAVDNGLLENGSDILDLYLYDTEETYKLKN